MNFNPAPDRRTLDVRKIDGPLTPTDQFFTTQHYGHPVVDPVAFRLKISGSVERPKAFSLDDLKKMRSAELMVGFECSGNRRPLQGLSGQRTLDRRPASVGAAAGRREAPGARVRLLRRRSRPGRCGVSWADQQGRPAVRPQPPAREGVVARTPPGLRLEWRALSKHQGSPLRLLVPGWYGVANVKWLSQIHIQEDPFLGKYQARWYRTLRGEKIDGEMTWVETAVTHMRLKSFIARVTRDGSRYKVLGVVLNDGTPLKSVEVRVDDGAWQPASLDPATKGKYSWKLFTYSWNAPAPGEHTLVSRVTDVTGGVQPTADDIATKKTFLEDNSQHPRKVMIS